MVRAIAKLLLFAVVFAAMPCQAAEVKEGDTVLALWGPANHYFVGTAVEKKGSGFLIVFEDGDMAVVDAQKIRANDIKVGTQVMARWSDGGYYSGKVGKIVGRALYIHYDDGDRGWTAWSGIAVK